MVLPNIRNINRLINSHAEFFGDVSHDLVVNILLIKLNIQIFESWLEIELIYVHIRSALVLNLQMTFIFFYKIFDVSLTVLIIMDIIFKPLVLLFAKSSLGFGIQFLDSLCGGNSHDSDTCELHFLLIFIFLSI